MGCLRCQIAFIWNWNYKSVETAWLKGVDWEFFVLFACFNEMSFINVQLIFMRSTWISFNCLWSSTLSTMYMYPRNHCFAHYISHRWLCALCVAGTTIEFVSRHEIILICFYCRFKINSENCMFHFKHMLKIYIYMFFFDVLWCYVELCALMSHLLRFHLFFTHLNLFR